MCVYAASSPVMVAPFQFHTCGVYTKPICYRTSHPPIALLAILVEFSRLRQVVVPGGCRRTSLQQSRTQTDSLLYVKVVAVTKENQRI